VYVFLNTWGGGDGRKRKEEERLMRFSNVVDGNLSTPVYATAWRCEDGYGDGSACAGEFVREEKAGLGSEDKEVGEEILVWLMRRVVPYPQGTQ
jgi:hypothetical protein